MQQYRNSSNRKSTNRNDEENPLNHNTDISLGTDEPVEQAIHIFVIDRSQLPPEVLDTDGEPDPIALRDFVMSSAVVPHDMTVDASPSFTFDLDDGDTEVDVRFDLDKPPTVSEIELREENLERRQRRFGAAKKVAAAGALASVAFVGAADPASAGAWLYSWGPSNSYITMDVWGSRAFVDKVVMQNYSVAGGPTTICRYQFAIRFVRPSGQTVTKYSPFNPGCVSAFGNASAGFSVKEYLAWGANKLCGFVYRDGAWYGGPCASIK